MMSEARSKADEILGSKKGLLLTQSGPQRLTQIGLFQFVQQRLGVFKNKGINSHHPISPIKNGPRPIVTTQGRNSVRMPLVLPMSAIGRSHLGNPVLRC